MTDVAIEVVLTADIEYRDGALRQDQWRVRRKAQIEEQHQQRKLEAERAERERQKRLEQARVDRLPRDGSAFRQAEDIINYVRAIRSVVVENTSSSEEFGRWREWALAQADRIDPAQGKAFMNAIQDEDKGNT